MQEARLKFSTSEMQKFAGRYAYQIDDESVRGLRPAIQERGHLTKDDLFKVARWKAPRSAGHVRKNTEEYIREVTSFCFSANSERARVQVLTNLDGLSWPTASVLLHLYHNDPYPILDFRALWSISLDVPTYYDFGFWWPYVEFCRALAEKANDDMRTLDKALWQYSKENQSS